MATWDCVYFGNYNTDVTFKKAPIEWRVLSIADGCAILLSEDLLDCKEFNTDGVEAYDPELWYYTDYSCTWETSTLRKWLNDEKNGFISEIFNSNELKSLKNKTNINRVYSGTDYIKSTTTVDKVYILSKDEICKSTYGFDVDGKQKSETRNTLPTTYAYIMGSGYTNKSDYNMDWAYWTRTLKTSNKWVCTMRYYGDYYTLSEQEVFGYGTSIRPVVCVDLSKINLNKKGIVSASSKITNDDINAQLVDDLIEGIGEVTIDSKDDISDARKAYDSLSDDIKEKVRFYNELEEAEKEFDALEHSNASPSPSLEPTTIPSVTPTANDTPSSTPSICPSAVPSITPTSKPTDDTELSVHPSASVVPSITPVTTPSPAVKKDNVTTFSIKNKAKVKKTAKIKIKDKDKIKKITLNGKTIKVKKNKTSFTLKLKSYKKKLKKKGKWNTLKVTDKKGNVKTIKFKTK